MITSQSILNSEYILDTSVIIILFEKCHLREELLKLSEKHTLYVPPKVEEEYFRGRNARSGLSDFQKIFKRINPPLENELLPYFNFESGYGEVWVISHAIRNPNCFCVIDEQLGRNVCEIFNLKLIGTIGLIDLMKGMNFFSAKKLLEIRETVRTCGFWLSEEVHRELDNVCTS